MKISVWYKSRVAVTAPFPAGEIPDLEPWLDRGLRALSSRSHRYKIGNLIDMGGGAVPVSVQRTIGAARPSFAFVDVELSAGSPIDPSIDVLVVGQPAYALSDDELARLDEFILRGKAACFLSGAMFPRPWGTFYDDPGRVRMDAYPVPYGLERLLAGYGVELHADMVLDPKNAASVRIGDQQPASLPFIPVARVADGTLAVHSPAFFGVQSVAVPFASSITLHAERQREATMSELIYSSDGAIRASGELLDLYPVKPAVGPTGHVLLGASIAGILHGAFDPAKRSARPARVLVVASSRFLSSPTPNLADLVDEYEREHLPERLLAFEGLLDWLTLNDESELVDCGREADAIP
jgi:hypothetical protein